MLFLLSFLQTSMSAMMDVHAVFQLLPLPVSSQFSMSDISKEAVECSMMAMNILWALYRVTEAKISNGLFFFLMCNWCHLSDILVIAASMYACAKSSPFHCINCHCNQFIFILNTEPLFPSLSSHTASAWARPFHLITIPISCKMSLILGLSLSCWSFKLSDPNNLCSLFVP